MIGQRLGHYLLMSQIGAGGMGVVYRARDERLDRDVAVKVLPPATVADEATRKRFRKEALALSRLNHPNIATIYDFDTQDGIDFLVMELVAGRAVEAAARAMSENEVVRLGIQLVDGLAAAHAQGVVHRDLKPGNLRLTLDGRLKILDFGLARLLQPPDDAAATISRSSPQALGTLPYMAPEQIRGESDARVDVYAAGAILYELATGQRLFPGTSGLALMDAILHRAIVPPQAVNSQISPALDRIIVKALDKDPERRYQSARELGVDLTRLGSADASAPVHGRHPEPRRRVAALAGALLLILTAVAVSLNLSNGRDRWRAGSTMPAIASLAVLPLANLSGDPEQDYFADGMTEALITDLGKIGALRVISRTSAVQYKDTRKSLPEIAHDLHVDAIVTGTVLRAGSRVRITAQLIHAPTDQHLWAEAYERDLRDILELQSDVAQAIANEIRAKVTPSERAAVHRTPAVNPGAYESYLKGQHYFNKRTEEGLRKSVEYFNDAISQDVGMARAHASLADAYSTLGYAGYAVLDPKDAMPKAKRAAQEALALDERSAEAYTTLAFISQNYDWDRSGSEKLYTRAIALNPNYARAHQMFAWHLAALGQHERARGEIEKARDLDPLSLIINHNVGWLAWYARQFDQAVAAYRTTLDLDVNFPSAHGSMGQALTIKGRYSEGIAEIEKAIDLLGGRPTVFVASLGYARAVSGDRAGAQTILAELIERSKTRQVPAYWIAVVYAGLGDRNRTFDWLERGYEERQGILVTLNVDPFFDAVRDDSRFSSLIRRVGFVP
jgi:serine/threonine-protein kinase